MPRLAAMSADDSELRFAIVAADEDVDFTQANLDLAIRWGAGPGEHEGEALESDGVIVVAAPSGGANVAIDWPGCPDGDGAAPVRVADAGLAIEAAAAGMGRACVPELLARADIAAGRVVAVGGPRAAGEGYWLVAPLPQWRQKKVRALVEALAS
jgi:LysR family glycine cleavage system transcriptional activator